MVWHSSMQQCVKSYLALSNQCNVRKLLMAGVINAMAAVKACGMAGLQCGTN